MPFFCLAIMQPKLKQKAEHITCKTIFLKKEKPALTRHFLLNQLLGFKNKTQRALLQHVTDGCDICTGFLQTTKLNGGLCCTEITNVLIYSAYKYYLQNLNYENLFI